MSIKIAEPPVAEKVRTEREVHGRTLVDNYAWMKDKNDPRVQKYIDEENAYTESVTEHTVPLQKELEAEFRGRMRHNDKSVPYYSNGYQYWSEYIKDQQYAVYKRRKEGEVAETIFDVNKFAEGYDYCDVAVVDPSPDNKTLVILYDTTGYQRYTLLFIDLETGHRIETMIKKLDAQGAWDNDSTTYLCVENTSKTNRSYKVVAVVYGFDGQNIKFGFFKLFEEPDEKFNVSVYREKSGKFLWISSCSKTTSSHWYVSGDAPEKEPTCFWKKQEGVEADVVSNGIYFYFWHNREGENFTLYRCPIAEGYCHRGEVVLEHRSDVKIEYVSSFKHFLAVFEREDSLGQVRIIPIIKDHFGNAILTESHRIQFPDQVYEVEEGTNAEYDSKFLRLEYQTLTTPLTVYDYGSRMRENNIMKVYTPTGYNENEYETVRIEIEARDGTNIPVTLAYKKDLRPDRTCNAPMFLDGYGSYGLAQELYFRPNIISLLDRGFIYAIPHIRGGGEFGEPWRLAGRMFNKMNTFNDYIDCAKGLIQKGFTLPKLLVAHGRSAGGMLMGAVANMEPDLFKAMVIGVPFVDVMNTMLDPDIPLSVGEYEEWGDPTKSKEAFAYMMQYSPYDNIEKKNYPAMFVHGGMNDPGVHFWEPLKYVAEMRDTRTDENTLILKINEVAGHHGHSGRYDNLKEQAFEYAFVLDQIR